MRVQKQVRRETIRLTHKSGGYCELGIVWMESVFFRLF